MAPRTKQKKARQRLERLISEYEDRLARSKPPNHGTEAISSHSADGNPEQVMLAVPTRQCIEEQLRQARYALTRLEAGAYGICDVCNDEISAERLDILPSATTCVQCASKMR